MSHLTNHAEEIFRFASIRAPGAPAPQPGVLELADPARIGAWLQEPTPTYPEVLAADPGSLSALWKFSLQAIAAGSPRPDALRQARALMAQAAALPPGTGVVLKLPAAFGQQLRAQRAAARTVVAQAAGADTPRERLHARLLHLQQLEAQLATALEQPFAVTESALPPPADTERAFHTHPAQSLDDAFRLAHPTLLQQVQAALAPPAPAGRYQLLDRLRYEGALAALELWRAGSGETAPAPEGSIRAAGVADLRVVRQTLLRYEKGELAHIENVIAGETRERRHERMQRTEESEGAWSEADVEQVREAQSTERDELLRWTFSLAREYQDRNAGISITANYGDLSIQDSRFMSEGRSNEQAIGEDQRRSREIINRALAIARARAGQQRWRFSIAEVREVTVHRQKAKCANVVAQYRWVDKVYQAQIYNYGARAVYEVSVALPQSALARAPARPLLQPADITDANWMVWSERLGVQLPAPPPSCVTERALAAFPAQAGAHTSQAGLTAQQAREQGYQPAGAGCSIAWYGVAGHGGVAASIGTLLFTSAQAGPVPARFLSADGGDIGFHAAPWGAAEQYTVNFYLEWVRTGRALQRWQGECHQRIMDDFERRLAAHQEQLRQQAANRVDTAALRAIEHAHLKRAALALIWRQAGLDRAPGEPEIRFAGHAFEWDQMTYRFHPREDEDRAPDTPQHGDPVFAAFLRAGRATLLLPVRPGCEDAVALFLEAGVVSDLPLAPADDDVARMNRDAVLSNALADEALPQGEPWTFRVPTSLVMLDDELEGPLPELARS